MRKFKATYLGLLAVLLAAVLFTACSQTPDARSAAEVGATEMDDSAVTTVYVVRHAEKEDGDDPSLTTRGRLRAQALAEMLGDDDIAAVFATQYLRTRETVEPLAKALGQEIQISDAGEPAELARRILREFAGTAVVAAAHSNTVPAMLTALGVSETVEIADKEYGDLFVVVKNSDGSVEFTRHRFGD